MILYNDYTILYLYIAPALQGGKDSTAIAVTDGGGTSGKFIAV